MDAASEAILALRPVSFRYKQEIEPNRAQMFGLIAEEVEQVDPTLVTRDEQGEPDTVRYEAINAMLLNEFLKEHCKVQELEATIVEQRKGNEILAAQMRAQTTRVEEVIRQMGRDGAGQKLATKP